MLRFLLFSLNPNHPAQSTPPAKMAYPRATIRPKRSRAAKANRSLLANIGLFALVLVSCLCFLPAGSLVRAAESDASEKNYGTVIGIDLG